MASYSNSVEAWVSGVSTPAGTKKGWKGCIWTANIATTTEPAADNSDWSISSPVKLQGLSVTQVMDPRDYLKIRLSGITLVETHVDRSSEVLLQGITITKLIPKPYLKITEG